MDKTIQDLEAELARRLRVVCGPDWASLISVEEVRDWADESLDEYEEELAREPGLAGQAYWDLWSLANRPVDALYVVFVFWPDHLEFFCGYGEPHAEIPGGVGVSAEALKQLREDLSRSITIPEDSLRVDKAVAQDWLGRSW